MSAKRKPGASVFAHLKPRAEGDDKDENKPADGKKAEGDDTEEDPEDEGTDGKKAGKNASKKAEDTDNDDTSAEDGDDESDKEDEKDDAKASARARERGRCAAIFQSPSAAVNPAAAAELAFGTSLPRSKAIGILDATVAAMPKPAPQASVQRETSLRQRMRGNAVAPATQDGTENQNRPGARLSNSLRHVRGDR